MTDVALPLMKESAHIPAETELMGRLLIESGAIRPSDLERILQVQKQRGLRFGEAAQSLGLVTAEDIRAILARQFSYPVVARKDPALSPSLVAALQPEHRRVEALRSLRSELMLRYFNQPENRRLAVVTVDQGGAGELCANLAVVFSQLGARTLLVDADLRSPSLHRLFGLSNARGLSDALAGRTAAVPRNCAPLGDLWLLNGGTQAPNPQELLARGRYQELMERFSEKFDVILFHCPPLVDNLDAQIVAARAGAVLMVAQEHVTPLRFMEKASTRLQDIGVRIVGVALGH